MTKKKQKKSILDKAVDAMTTPDEKEPAKEAKKAADAARFVSFSCLHSWNVPVQSALDRHVAVHPPNKHPMMY